MESGPGARRQPEQTGVAARDGVEKAQLRASRSGPLSGLLVRGARRVRTTLLGVAALAFSFGPLHMALGAGAPGYTPNAVPNPGDDASAPATQSVFAQQLAEARRAYFADLEGDRGADDRARQQFAAMAAQWPHQPVVDAYLGSLDLLESARTLAVWRKHTLAADGLEKLDAAVNHAPDDLEARFVRALTTWHLPFFFHRKEQAEQDLSYLGPRAEQAAHQGRLPAPLAAAALDYWGQVLADADAADKDVAARNVAAARQAFEAAVRVDASSPGGQDARKRLGR